MQLALHAHAQHADQHQQCPRHAHPVRHLAEGQHLDGEGQHDVEGARYRHLAGALHAEGPRHQQLAGQAEGGHHADESPLPQAVRQAHVPAAGAQVGEQAGGDDEGPGRQLQHHHGEVHVLALAHDDDVGGREHGGEQRARVPDHVVAVAAPLAGGRGHRARHLETALNNLQLGITLQT